MEKTVKTKLINKLKEYRANWNKYAKEVLNVSLDSDQRDILEAIQNNNRVSIRSGHSRGKDYVSAVAAVCFITLYSPSKVIMTAPTERQVLGIMIAELKKIWKNAKYPLGGELMSHGVKIPQDDTHYLIGFKAGDKEGESWTGFHSQNIMVVVTEATGLPDAIFNSVESVLQNNSRLVLAFNPIKVQGEAYQSTRKDSYKAFKLNCLNAPNVANYQKYLNGEISYEQYENEFIPGQVDYSWVKDKLNRPGWTKEIEQRELPEDFAFDGKIYRPENIFKMKVLGEFPDEDEDSLITTTMLEAAFERYNAMTKEELQGHINGNKLKVGIDIAGMGRDMNVIAQRSNSVIFSLEAYTKKHSSIHMEMAGKVQNIYNRKKYSEFFIDAIGEGAGVVSRLAEKGYKENVVAAKGSQKTKHLTDSTKNLKFVNMRAYLYWRLREEIQNGLAIQPNNQLMEELTQTKYEFTSNGLIKIEDKEEIKKRIGRSPDFSDALTLTFYPEKKIKQSDGKALQNLM